MISSQRARRALATAVLVAISAAPVLQGVAFANDVPPASTHTLQNCLDEYNDSRGFAFSAFRESFIKAATTKADLVSNLFFLLATLEGLLKQYREKLVNCAITAVDNTGGAIVLSALSAKPKHHHTRGHGKGGGSTSVSCLATFDASVAKAATAENQALGIGVTARTRKRHGKPRTTPPPSSPSAFGSVADAFDSAVQAAGQTLTTCVNNLP